MPETDTNAQAILQNAVSEQQKIAQAVILQQQSEAQQLIGQKNIADQLSADLGHQNYQNATEINRLDTWTAADSTFGNMNATESANSSQNEQTVQLSINSPEAQQTSVISTASSFNNIQSSKTVAAINNATQAAMMPLAENIIMAEIASTLANNQKSIDDDNDENFGFENNAADEENEKDDEEKIAQQSSQATIKADDSQQITAPQTQEYNKWTSSQSFKEIKDVGKESNNNNTLTNTAQDKLNATTAAIQNVDNELANKAFDNEQQEAEQQERRNSMSMRR